MKIASSRDLCDSEEMRRVAYGNSFNMRMMETEGSRVTSKFQTCSF